MKIHKQSISQTLKEGGRDKKLREKTDRLRQTEQQKDHETDHDCDSSQDVEKLKVQSQTHRQIDGNTAETRQANTQTRKS